MEGDEDRLPLVGCVDRLLRFCQRDGPSGLRRMDDVVCGGWLSGGLHVSRGARRGLGGG